MVWGVPLRVLSKVPLPMSPPNGENKKDQHLLSVCSVRTPGGCYRDWTPEKGWASSSRGPWAAARTGQDGGLDVTPSVEDSMGTSQKDQTRVARKGMLEEVGFLGMSRAPRARRQGGHAGRGSS